MQHLLDEIQRYLDAKHISNVGYQDLKRRAERAWERDRRTVGGPRSIDPTWNDVHWTAIPKSIRVAYDNVSVLMLHHVATRKLVDVSDDSRGQRYNDLVERWRPVSIGLRDLKQYAVKGRKQLTAEQQEAIAADAAARRTCQICGRKILLVNGAIAHHGFERPGHGQQTASCWGALYLPLERSNKRLAWYVDLLKRQVEDAERVVRDWSRHTGPVYLVRLRKELPSLVHRSMPAGDVDYSRVSPDDLRWERIVRTERTRADYEFKQVLNDLKFHKQRLERS